VTGVDSGPDDALWRRILAGDPQGLAEAYDAHAAAVHRVAYRLLGDPSGAQDVVQDVFLLLWERPDRFDPERGRLRQWLCAAARNRVIDMLRRAETGSRRVRLLADGLGRPDNDPADAAVRDASSQAVRAAVESLPEVYRVPLLLAYYGGLSYREVAATLGLAEGTAKSRLRWAMHRLAERLAEQGLTD
jgi:RNA polymerase sigma factor (sigma-70 family)